MVHGFVMLAVVVASQANDATHELAFDGSGKLAFMQTKMESSNVQSALYNVEIGFDIEAMEAAKGVTMQFDKSKHVLRLDSGIATTGVAWGRYMDEIPKTGWSELYLDTTQNKEVSNDVRMYGAGFIEGLITAVRLSEYHSNTHKLLMRTEAAKHAIGNIKKVFSDQIAFIKAKAMLVPHVMAEEPNDPYWKHTRYVLFQMWGVCDGYNHAAATFGTHKLALEDLIVLNTGGELAELIEAYTPKARSDRASAQSFAAVQSAGNPSFLQRNSVRARVSEQNLKVRRSRAAVAANHNLMVGSNATKEDLLDDAHWEKLVSETGHCSALVKLTTDNRDLIVGHTTWDDYSRMTRIYKYYNFHLDGADTMATKIGFSSYPGLVSSTDNYYIMSSGLQVMDTSIEILNPFIWDKVEDFPMHPHIPNFVHLMVTNRLAKSGAHWTRLMATQNTGTQTSQWMVIDWNRFKANKVVPDETFWVLEAVPGMTHAADMSHHLRDNGYWPSFNRPYFDDIREATGFATAQKTKGAIYSWLNNPRAKIFRAMQGNANNLAEVRLIMTRNFYPLTGVMPLEPGHEISARMDLSPTMAIPNGGIDAKISNHCMAPRLQAQTISSPAHSAIAPFSWKTAKGLETFPGFPHEGLPDVWNFEWIQQSPMKVVNLFDWSEC